MNAYRSQIYTIEKKKNGLFYLLINYQQPSRTIFFSREQALRGIKWRKNRDELEKFKQATMRAIA